jgi:hypothetical protein
MKQITRQEWYGAMVAVLVIPWLLRRRAAAPAPG